jgi:hypothetical protein
MTYSNTASSEQELSLCTLLYVVRPVLPTPYHRDLGARGTNCSILMLNSSREVYHGPTRMCRSSWMPPRGCIIRLMAGSGVLRENIKLLTTVIIVIMIIELYSPNLWSAGTPYLQHLTTSLSNSMAKWARSTTSSPSQANSWWVERSPARALSLSACFPLCHKGHPK